MVLNPGLSAAIRIGPDSFRALAAHFKSNLEFMLQMSGSLHTPPNKHGS